MNNEKIIPGNDPETKTEVNKTETKNQLNIGFLTFPRQDQIDFTGPFEVLSRMPDSIMHIISKSTAPFRDVKGLIITPELSIAEAPELDMLVVSGGLGQQDLMHDEEILGFIRRQFESGKFVFSICTGALLCGAAGILRGKQATTHWASWKLLEFYGAIPVKSRFVIDGNYISTAGITAGIDGALKVAAILRGVEAAKEIQLDIEYAPDPPFHSGTPDTASWKTVAAFFEQYGGNKESREKEALEFAKKFRISVAGGAETAKES